MSNFKKGDILVAYKKDYPTPVIIIGTTKYLYRLSFNDPTKFEFLPKEFIHGIYRLSLNQILKNL